MVAVCAVEGVFVGERPALQGVVEDVGDGFLFFGWDLAPPGGEFVQFVAEFSQDFGGLGDGLRLCPVEFFQFCLQVLGSLVVRRVVVLVAWHGSSPRVWSLLVEFATGDRNDVYDRDVVFAVQRGLVSRGLRGCIWADGHEVDI